MLRQNVLEAIGMISKTKKSIRWKGWPTVRLRACAVFARCRLTGAPFSADASLEGLPPEGCVFAKEMLASARRPRRACGQPGRADKWLRLPAAPAAPQGLGRSAEERLRAERAKAMERLDAKRQLLEVGWLGSAWLGAWGLAAAGRGSARVGAPRVVQLLAWPALATSPRPPPAPPPNPPTAVQDAIQKCYCLSNLVSRNHAVPLPALLQMQARPQRGRVSGGGAGGGACGLQGGCAALLPDGSPLRPALQEAGQRVPNPLKLPFILVRVRLFPCRPCLHGASPRLRLWLAGCVGGAAGTAADPRQPQALPRRAAGSGAPLSKPEASMHADRAACPGPLPSPLPHRRRMRALSCVWTFPLTTCTRTSTLAGEWRLGLLAWFSALLAPAWRRAP